MGTYLIRRLLIAIPSLLGISVVLFTVLALAPGDPFEEMATNPNIPPEVRMALREKFGIDDPVYIRYIRWLTAMAQGDWGFSFASRINVDVLILQRVPATHLRRRLLADPGADASRFRWASMRRRGPIRSSTRSPTRFAFVGFSSADLLHRPAVDPGVLDLARLAALRVPLGHSRERAGAGSGSRSGRRSCRWRCWACSRRPPIRATCARPCWT
jgi:hypothetical protein